MKNQFSNANVHFVPDEELFGELGERYYRMMLRSYPALAVPTSQLTWNSGADMRRPRAGVGAEGHRCEHVWRSVRAAAAGLRPHLRHVMKPGP